MPESDAPADPLDKESAYSPLKQQDEHYAMPVCRADIHSVRELSDLLSQVKDEQSYIVVRERTHRNTAESTNARVKWWSIFQLGVLIGEGIFQVWWLKRFFEVKRVV